MSFTIIYGGNKIVESFRDQISNKFQFSKFNDQNNFIAVLNTRLPKVLLVRRAGLVIDIWNLSRRTSFVICLLLSRRTSFGALILNLFDFIDYLVYANTT